MDILSEMEEDLLTQSKNADRSIKEKERSDRDYTYSELGRLIRVIESDNT